MSESPENNESIDPSAHSRDSELEHLTPDQMPQADFNTLSTMIASQAMVALGAIPNPATGRAEPQPVLASYFVDLLSVLQEKTAGNLTDAENDGLEQTLHQLRMAYVELTREK